MPTEEDEIGPLMWGVHSPSLLKLLGLAARKAEKCGLLAGKLNVLYVYHKL